MFVSALTVYKVSKNQTPALYEQKIQRLLVLKHDIALIDNFEQLCLQSSNPLLQAFANVFHDPQLSHISDLLDNMLSSDIQASSKSTQNERLYAVKSGESGEGLIS